MSKANHGRRRLFVFHFLKSVSFMRQIESVLAGSALSAKPVVQHVEMEGDSSVTGYFTMNTE